MRNSTAEKNPAALPSGAEGGRVALASGTPGGQARVYHNRAGASYPLRLLANNSEGSWKCSMNDNPWFKFYPGDWANNAELQGCSLAARGLWIELLRLMRGCPREGFLAVSGKAMPAERIARAVNAETAEVVALLAELEAARVVKRIDGVIASTRMIRYAGKRDAGRDAVDKRWNRPQDAPNATPNRSPLIGKRDRCDGSESSDSDSGSSSASLSGSGVSEVRSLNPETQSQGKVKKNNTRQRAPATGPNAEVIRAFEAEFLRVRGAKYAFGGAKDGEAVAAVLEFAGGDPAKVIERIPWLFRDPWRRERASLALLRAKWNECLPPAAPAQTTFVDSTQEPENAAFIAQLRANAARQEAEKAAKRNGAVVGGAA